MKKGRGKKAPRSFAKSTAKGQEGFTPWDSPPVLMDLPSEQGTKELSKVLLQATTLAAGENTLNSLLLLLCLATALTLVGTGISY